MRILLAIVFSLLFLQTSFPNTNESFYFDCSASVFKGSEGKSIVELYYAVYQKFLKYNPNTSGGFSADAKLDVYIYPKNSSTPLAVNSYKIPSVINDTSSDNIKNKIIGQVNYEMKYGAYTIIVAASDFNNPQVRDSIEFDLQVEDFTTGVKMSDLELATSIVKSGDTKNLFYKNTLEVTPNAGGLYGKNLSELYYYAELYNLNADNISEEFTIKRRVLSLNNEELLSSDKKIKRNADSRVEFGMFKIDSLKTGSYIFELSIIDPAKNVNVLKTKKFFLYTTSDDKFSSNKGQDDYLKSEYSTITENDIDELFQKTIYIRTTEENELYGKMTTLDDKRKFMYAFWKRRDNVPGTPQNEFKIVFLKRINEANKLYKENFKEGWKTDRGRLHILYGAPSEIERFPFEATTKGYEIWRFDAVQGGTMAIFVERESGGGTYTLVHSTLKDELKNENWKAELK
jgi:GWxTD domain-containing protein